MSWSFTLNGIAGKYEIDDSLRTYLEAVSPDYPADAEVALAACKALGLSSAVCTGMRAPSLYGGPETISIGVMGTREAVDFNAHVKANIGSGPDDTVGTGGDWTEHAYAGT
jgi:hypothetical protein